jgi:predicted PurR-regulated permease PerM
MSDKRHRPSPQDRPGRLNQSHYFLFFLLFASIYASFRLLQPYLNAIILAAILSILLAPAHRKIEQWVRGRKNLAALLSCLLLILVIVLPLTFMLFALIQQGIQSATAIYDWIAAGKHETLLDTPWMQKLTALADQYLPDIQKFFPDLKVENLQLDKLLLNLSSSLGKVLLNQGGSLFGNVTAVIWNFFLMIFAFYFIIRDREKIFKAILHLIPLSGTQEERIINKITAVSKSAILGTLVTAMAQGAASGIGFAIVGFPGLFWGAVMGFASLIPVIGMTLIWVPAASYLFLTERWGYGIFMVIWFILIVGSIDNFLRPLFMKAGEDTSMLLIFFALLGGLNSFGLIGLLYGPLILGLMLILLYIYSLEFKSFLTHQDRT